MAKMAGIIQLSVFGRRGRHWAFWLALVPFLGALGSIAAVPARAEVSKEPPVQLEVLFTLKDVTAQLASWSHSELKSLKQQKFREKAPASPSAATWKGPLLREVVDQALEKLTLDQRANIDLVILRSSQGDTALVPRSFIVKFPLILALAENGKPLDEKKGPIYSIPPRSGYKKMEKENLPLETFFVAGLSKVELTSYKDRYGTVFLKRRTDPFAIRGETYFVQSCTACHGAGRGPSVPEVIGLSHHSTAPQAKKGDHREVASTQHPLVEGLPQITGKNWRAFFNYLEAYRFENSRSQQQ